MEENSVEIMYGGGKVVFSDSPDNGVFAINMAVRWITSQDAINIIHPYPEFTTA